MDELLSDLDMHSMVRLTQPFGFKWTPETFMSGSMVVMSGHRWLMGETWVAHEWDGT